MVTDLAPSQSSGGKGKERLFEPVERIIRELLHKRFLTRQKRSLATFYREVARTCQAQKLPVPARNTVALAERRSGPRESRAQQRPPIPYRTLSHPAITLWEQRQALARLRQLGRDQVDEAALFRMIRQMRDIVDTAKRSTCKARRDAQRRQHLKTPSPPSRLTPPADTPEPKSERQMPAPPFDQIEEW